MADLVARGEAEVLIYQGEDGRTRIEVRFDGETAWLSLGQMAQLFQRDKSVISRHIANVFEEGEIALDGKAYQVEFYNLDVIISVGYRVKSHQGTQFRIWATQRLREYLIKGFTLDDERLKRGGGGNYFDELLARIRDIRSSEKVFWRKVLDIYATSIDYDPGVEASQRFFAAVQNKMHWAAHGKTAAEVIVERVDATRPNMGLTSWAGPTLRKADVAIAKNYLDVDELDALNKIVTAYLDFAEVQALNRRPMYMVDWITKLDEFLKLADREVLVHAGSISHAEAVQKSCRAAPRLLRRRWVSARYSRRVSTSGAPSATLPAITFVSRLRTKLTTRSASSSDGMFGEVFEVETARSRGARKHAVSSRSGASWSDPQVV